MTDSTVTEAVKRIERFAANDEHWQLVWPNSAAMKFDMLSALAMQTARNPGTDEDVERVERAIHAEILAIEQEDGGEGAPWEEMDADQRQMLSRIARAAIAAIAALSVSSGGEK